MTTPRSLTVIRCLLAATVWFPSAGPDPGGMPTGGRAVAADHARGDAAASNAAGDEADWTIPTAETVAQWMEEWIARASLDAETSARVRAAWQGRSGSPVAGRPSATTPPDGAVEGPSAEQRDVPAEPLIDRLVAAMAEADPRILPLLHRGGPSRQAGPAEALDQDGSWLQDPEVDPFLRETIRLQMARLLVEQGLFEEALRTLETADGVGAASRVDLSRSVDPARRLFLEAACRHWLLDSDRAVDTLERLLERADDIPVRYERMARLMLDDLRGLENDSLDHIARRMRDVTRRLSFGRAGAGTRQVQDGVIESLDKLIAKLEQQQQEQNSQGGGAGSGAGGGSGSKPMQDSMPAGGTGPGEVTKRDLGDPADWGSLPPREREAALQQIGREFPPHYREAIEQYFKRLAAGKEPSSAAGPIPRP